jgi:hypothetical protein
MECDAGLGSAPKRSGLPMECDAGLGSAPKRSGLPMERDLRPVFRRPELPSTPPSGPPTLGAGLIPRAATA